MRSFSHERFGVYRTHSLPHSKSWIPSHSSRRRPSWANSWKPGSHNRSSPRGAVSAGRPFPTSNQKPLRRWSSSAMGRGVAVMFTLFPLGQIVATPGALAALERSQQPASCFLARHAIGDWGELDPPDVAENEYGMVQGLRLLSSYKTVAGEKGWIITEAERSAATLLLTDGD